MKIRKIFLVDDDEIATFLNRKALHKIGFAGEIECFSNGKELLDHIKINYFVADLSSQENEILILLDLNMPIMDGWEFLDIFRKFPDIKKDFFKIIILTNSSNVDDVALASTYKEVLKYLNKPLLIEQIYPILNDLK